jgi:RNA polymerase-interacting CarD/CdnL/TRCF family regulator
MSKNGHDFSVGDHVVYPAHGVGQVQGIETQEVAAIEQIDREAAIGILNKSLIKAVAA